MNSSCLFPPPFLSALGIINAQGLGIAAINARLFAGNTSGMVLAEDWLPNDVVRVGRVVENLPEIPRTLAAYDCRNNRLLLAACGEIRDEIDTLIAHYGKARIAIVLGTSNSGIAEAEEAIARLHACGQLPTNYHYAQQELGSPALFLAAYLGIKGPAFGVSTACTSSSKALISARSLLRAGLCDAVITGGVDALCKLTLNGFAALESLSKSICNPLSKNRSGINIGEGAALFLMTREALPRGEPIVFYGAGESSDAYHISAPHPEGLGAELAMRSALQNAGFNAHDVDYLNMHATATPKNDAAESIATQRVFADGVATSGTKPLTGHLLGAAGVTGIAHCWLALRDGRLPPHHWDGVHDETLPRLDIVSVNRRFTRQQGRLCLANSFAFGGNNASVLIGDAR